MFGGLGDLQQMYKKYQELQKKLANTLIRAKQDGVVIDITADMKVKEVTIEDESLLSLENKEKLEEAIKQAFIKGQQKATEVAMQKTKEILGFDPNEITKMFWSWMGGFPGLN